MSAPCPKCGHKRRPTDIVPDYECPRCGIVYAKYLEALHEKAAAADRAPAEQQKQGAITPGQTLLGLLIGVGAIWYMSQRQEQTAPTPPPPKPAPVSAPAQQTRPSPTSTTAPAAPKPKTAAQLEEDRVNKLEMMAREICFDAIKAKALFPSTVDIAWFTGTATARQGSATLVKAAFTSKNALGNELPFYGMCRVTDTGKLEHYSQTPR